MKISEMIKILTRFQKKHGDLDVIAYDGVCDYGTPKFKVLYDLSDRTLLISSNNVEMSQMTAQEFSALPTSAPEMEG